MIADVLVVKLSEQTELCSDFRLSHCAAFANRRIGKPPYLPLGSRRDVLVYETTPLEADLEVTGPIEVKLWGSSSAPDTDFTAKLIDVYPPSRWYPNGYALNLTDSIMRLRYRNGPDEPDFLPPGASGLGLS